MKGSGQPLYLFCAINLLQNININQAQKRMPLLSLAQYQSKNDKENERKSKSVFLFRPMLAPMS
jgi:hypothetical protein